MAVHTGAGLTDAVVVVAGCTGQVGKPVAAALAARGNEVHGLARFRDEAARVEMEAAGVTCHAVDLVDPDLSAVPRDVDHLLNFAVARFSPTVVPLGTRARPRSPL